MRDQHVNVDNFERAETDRMFEQFVNLAGGVNRWYHIREPTPLDHQPVVRMNRDTLYSGAVVDVSAGATVALPDAGDRYLSLMVVDEDHYISHVFHDAGDYQLAPDQFDTSHVAVIARVLVNPADTRVTSPKSWRRRIGSACSRTRRDRS